MAAGELTAPAAAPLLGAAGLCPVALWLLPVPWIDLDGAAVFGALDRIAGPFGLSPDRAGDLRAIAGVLGLVAAPPTASR